MLVFAHSVHDWKSAVIHSAVQGKTVLGIKTLYMEHLKCACVCLCLRGLRNTSLLSAFQAWPRIKNQINIFRNYLQQQHPEHVEQRAAPHRSRLLSHLKKKKRIPHTSPLSPLDIHIVLTILGYLTEMPHFEESQHRLTDWFGWVARDISLPNDVRLIFRCTHILSNCQSVVFQCCQPKNRHS